MRSLAQPEVLWRALIAAALSTLAAWPRLAGWKENATPVWFLAGILFWSSFCLWAAVFAWQEQYSHRPLVNLRVPGREWLLGTLAGVGVAVLFSQTLDPLGRSLRPNDYPLDAAGWAAQALFNLGFELLFCYLAPFAFFIRLTHSVTVAAAGTAVLRLFMLWWQSAAAQPGLTAGGVLLLAGGRVLMTALVLTVFLRGGLLPVWWIGLLLQSRHLLALFEGR